jgi:predicted nucleotidyltransferase
VPDSQPHDPERIFRVLDARGVEYVVVGGLAVQVHGHVRTTNDVDIIPAPTPRNLASLADALNELDARVLNQGSEGIAIDAKMLARAVLWQFSTSAGDIDVLHDAPGAAAFAELRARALEVRLGGLEIPFAGRDDLIRMKRAAGRPVDFGDIAALTEHDKPDA